MSVEMPRRFFLSCLVLFAALAALAHASVNRGAAPASSASDDFTAEELAQGYRAGIVLAKPRTAHRAGADTAEPGEGFTMHRKYSRFGDLRVLKIAAGQSVAEAVARLKATGRYEFVEPDYLRHARVLPNDPNLSQQWALSNFGQTGGTSGADIRASLGWDILHDAPNVIVAVIDSGIRLTHSDLAANLWTNPSPSTSGDLHGIRYTGSLGRVTSGNPNDDVGHGTHVAGIIGAVGNNGVGISGVAWKVQLMGLKFLTASGGGSPSDEIACIDYAIAHGASIINASFGADASSNAELTAIAAARDAGIIFVAAAGNGDSNGIGFSTDNGGDYPAGYLLDNIVTVAASNASDALTTFSNFGAGSVDLAAPGDSVYSTYNTSDTSYQTFSGTSMAAPHVAGALALLKAKFPSDTYRQLINRLLRSVTPLATMRGKVQSGGRLNLQAALSSTDNRPLNDDFASRATVSGSNVRIRASNVGATTESGEPAHADVTGGPSLWWTWTAPTSTQVTLDTSGSSYDTILAVYTGSSLGSLVTVGSNDDAAPGTLTSRLTLDVTAGTVYQIAVTGKGGATGQTNLRIGSVPANDTFAKAQTVSGASFLLSATNLNATAEPGEPKPIAKSANHSVWYKWTAPTSGRFLLSAFALQIDTTAAVFTGTAVNALTLVASNDNSSATNSDALVPFNAVAGQTYFFAVDSTAAEGGDFVLSLVDALWAYPTVGAIMSSPAAASDGTIYVGAGASDDSPLLESRVHAVNPDGTVKWTFTTATRLATYPFDVSSPAVGPDGTVYIGGSDGFFYALNPANGTRKWRFPAATAIGASPAIADTGTIYFHDDTTLYALTDNANAAIRKWSFALNGTSYASPALAPDGTVYLGTTGGNFYAITPAGVLKWVFAADGDIFTTAAIANDGTVYFGTLSGAFYALNPDGTLKWKWRAATTTSITSSPALAPDGTIYFAAYDKNLYALRSDGTLRWSFAAAEQVRASSPAVGADGTIYFGDYDFQLYAVNPDGTLKRTYATGQVVRSSPLLFNNRLYAGSNDGKLYAIDIGQGPAASAWPMYRQNAARVSRTVAAPTITTAPRSQSVGIGGGLVLSVAAGGTGPFTYQWSKDGATIAGATASTYSVGNVSATTAGRYTVTVTGPGGLSVTSSPAVVTTATAIPARLTNLSVQTTAGGTQTLTLGFVLSGSPEKSLLVRGIGPGLTAFNLTGVLADPVLTVLGPNSSTLVAAQNDNWSNTTAAAMAAAGAFPLTSGSKDAALLATLAAGNYTAQITGATPGLALAEIYDTAIGTGAKLINLSTSAQVSAGGSLTAGFTISGNVAKTVLIRGLGPALATLGVGGTLSDPKLELYDGASNLLQSNDDWGATPTLVDAFTQTGAFKFGTSPTKDAVLLVTLAPGSYTALVRGATPALSGLALVEIYEMP
jgi:outer membrane protein assembly factor BamB/subtilisin family serine protease